MKLLRFLPAAFIFFLAGLNSGFSQTQFFSLPGAFTFNSNATNQVMDVDPSGTIGIALRTDPADAHLPLLSTFNPATGQVLDNKTFGFGPLHVKLAQLPEGLRAVVLTSQGGPRNLFLFGISPTGVLTQIAQTQLTTSINDGGSNPVVSPSARTGFALVFSPTAGPFPKKDLVSFSLVDGSISGRVEISPTLGIADYLSMVETPDGRRLLAFFSQISSVSILDATNVSNPVLSGTVALPFVTTGSLLPAGVAFSLDGNYMFAANGASDLSAIDVKAKTVVGSIGGTFRYGAIEISKGASAAQLAAFTVNGSATSVSLIETTDPAHLSVIGRYSPTGVTQKSTMKFSKDGRNLYVLTNTAIAGLDIPSLHESFSTPIPGGGVFLLPAQLIAPGYCSPERVISAFGNTTASFASTNVTRTITGSPRARDFDGDGKSDILLRDPAGNVSMWQMNGLAVSINADLGNIWPGWSIVGSGDFNADGKSDILWRDPSGNVTAWLMDGIAVCGYNIVGTMPASTVVAAVTDFDGDHKAEILSRSSNGDVVIWRMNGASILSNTTISNIWMGWTIAGAGDFNGDGKSDILWRSVTGEVAIWMMDGIAVTSSSNFASMSTNWSVAGVGDFNGDGKSDILWRSNSGDVAIWMMNGSTVLSSNALANIWTGWVISAVRDFDGDGRSDILWQDPSGNVAVWLMNGATVASYAGVSNTSNRTVQ